MKALQKNRSLSTLNLAHNGLAYDGCLSLSKALTLNTTLKSLDVSANNINWKGALLVADGLKKNECLETLFVSLQHWLFYFDHIMHPVTYDLTFF